MSLTYYIDGNNLLYAMRASAPIANVGRETMVRVIEKWLTKSESESGKNYLVTLVFDGPTPRGAMANQIASQILTVEFSAARTADDLLIDAIHVCPDPGATYVVTADRAILHEAGVGRCRRVSPEKFIAEIFREPKCENQTQPSQPEKPGNVTNKDAKELLDLLGDAHNDLEDFDLEGL